MVLMEQSNMFTTLYKVKTHKIIMIKASLSNRTVSKRGVLYEAKK